jgi:hypothetical protein
VFCRLVFDDQSGQTIHKTVCIRVPGDERPVKPSRLVVLTVPVIVTVLGAAHFVAHQNHRQAQREHRRGQKVLHLPVSQLLYFSIIAWAFDAAIPTSVVVRAIAVIFTVGFIMLLVVGHEVIGA